MTVEQIDDHEAREQHVGVQIQQLARELSDFANNNPRFRKGLVDYIYINVGEADACKPIEVDDENELDDDAGEDDGQYQGEITYSFQAERKRRLLDGEQIAWIEFLFSVTGVEYNVNLPGHIAEDELGLPAEEAIREAGLVRRMTSHIFRLNTRKRQVGLMEELTYTASDGEPITSYCVGDDDGNDELMYIADQGDGEQEGVVLDLSEIKQYSSYQLDSRHESDPIVLSVESDNIVSLLAEMD
ncbi:MAG: hypothetical protein ACREGB_03690, partial [Candidatus Saccharimonadales bacterium]